jgi:hypothetical protein
MRECYFRSLLWRGRDGIRTVKAWLSDLGLDNHSYCVNSLVLSTYLTEAWLGL